MEAKAATINFPCKLDYSYLLSLCGLEEAAFCKSDDVLRFYIGEGSKRIPIYKDEEAYALEITPTAINIAANTEKGISNGLKTLAVLVEKHGAILPCLIIEDKPEIEFRAIHLCIFNPNDGTEKEDTSPESVRKMLITAALSGYNHVFMEFWGMFPYRKRPYACWPNDLYPREVVQELIDFALYKLHMQPLPCQNLVSHAGWSRIMSRKHVVLDQRPDLSDMWIPGGWCFATENPDTKAFLKDIIDDLLETYHNPPLMHVSSDKCFGFGSTEEDRTKPADALFVIHLCNLNTYLQSKGTRMAMWGDMLYSSMDSLFWKASPKCAELLPKNILINIWTHNDIGNNWLDVDFFENLGFETVYSPFINRKGTENMVKLCAKKKSKGIVQTTWHRPKTATPEVIFSGAIQWNGKVPDDEKLAMLKELF